MQGLTKQLLYPILQSFLNFTNLFRGRRACNVVSQVSFRSNILRNKELITHIIRTFSD